MTARAGAVGREPSAETLIEGRTDIDVIMVTVVRREEIRMARM
jgi:hypothetical protein